LFAFNIHSMSEEFKTYLYQIYWHTITSNEKK
jgi:hypothetical protein